mgnify:CR=1 FL=1
MNFAERKNKGMWGSTYNRDSLRDDYERKLFLESFWDDSIECDSLTGETILKSYETWIENTLKITYQYNGQKFEKKIKRESYRKPYKVDQKLYVSFCTDSPETVIDISDEDIFIGLKMMQYCTILLLFIMVLLVSLFYIN